MRKTFAMLIGIAGFFMAVGAGGGIECDTMGWGEALAWIGVGMAMMCGSAIYARRCR